MKDDIQDIIATETPDLGALMTEFQRSGTASHWSVQRQYAAEVRLTSWDGQTLDGKKHREALGDEPFPWEGAADGRIPLVDDIINEIGDVLFAAFKRAQVRAIPREMGDLERAQNLAKIIGYYRDRDAGEIDAEAELMWQFGLSDGAAVWQVTWEREISLRRHKITMSDLQMLSAQTLLQAQQENRALTAQEQALVNLPESVKDPFMEEELSDLVKTYAAQLAAGVINAGVMEDYTIKPAAARRVVRDLRESGAAEFPVPYLKRSGPVIMARQIGVDLFVPPETTELARSSVVFVREWLAREEIAELVMTEGWSEEWAERAYKTRGQTSTWETPGGADLALLDPGEEGFYSTIDGEHGSVEVVHAYRRLISEDGVPEIWVTTFSPHFQRSDQGDPLWAKHAPLGYLHGEYPFTEYRRERLGRRLDYSRGVAQVAATWQDEMKRQCDMLSDRASIEINPPVLINNRLAVRYGYGPGRQIPTLREGDIRPFPAPSGSPQLAFNVLEMVQARAANYFGLIHPAVLPAKWQNRLQAAVDRFLNSARVMFTQVGQLIQQMASEEELARIAGQAPGLPRSPEEIAGQYDVTLEFNVQDLDMDFVMKKLEAVANLAVPLDRAGVIDVTNLVKLVLNAIDPSLGRAILADQQSASQALFRQVQNDLALIYLGNQPPLVENDPTAEQKLRFVKDIVDHNAKYTKALRPDGGEPEFAQLYQKYVMNLQQSVNQQENKMIGRLGVRPQAEI